MTCSVEKSIFNSIRSAKLGALYWQREYEWYKEHEALGRFRI